MKGAVIAFAAAHPFLSLVGVWLASGAVRGVVSAATGYDALALFSESLTAAAKAKAKAKATTDARP